MVDVLLVSWVIICTTVNEYSVVFKLKGVQILCVEVGVGETRLQLFGVSSSNIENATIHSG
jgi:hypothetical protein